MLIFGPTRWDMQNSLMIFYERRTYSLQKSCTHLCSHQLFYHPSSPISHPLNYFLCHSVFIYLTYQALIIYAAGLYLALSAVPITEHYMFNGVVPIPEWFVLIRKSCRLYKFKPWLPCLLSNSAILATTVWLVTLCNSYTYLQRQVVPNFEVNYS